MKSSSVVIFSAYNFFAALCGVVIYNYIKVRDVRSSQLPPESIPERMTKVGIIELVLLSVGLYTTIVAQFILDFFGVSCT